MSNDIASLTSTIEAAIKARTIRLIQMAFRDGIAHYGSSKAAVGGYCYLAAAFRGLARPCIDRDDMGYADALNADKVDAFAAKVASDAVAGIAAKVAAKVGALDDMRFNHVSGASFEVTGTRNGRRVHLVQDIVVNTSSKGTVFNQYPATIYLDRKRISAAKYAASF
jgi:hypothetical protein